MLKKSKVAIFVTFLNFYKDYIWSNIYLVAQKIWKSIKGGLKWGFTAVDFEPFLFNKGM